MLRPHCIYVFCIYLRTNGDLCHLQHKLIGFYNQDEKCLQRGTDWVFKYSSLHFVFKGLKYRSILSVVRTLQVAKMYCNKQKMDGNKWIVVGGVSVVQVW